MPLMRGAFLYLHSTSELWLRHACKKKKPLVQMRVPVLNGKSTLVEAGVFPKLIGRAALLLSVLISRHEEIDPAGVQTPDLVVVGLGQGCGFAVRARQLDCDDCCCAVCQNFAAKLSVGRLGLGYVEEHIPVFLQKQAQAGASLGWCTDKNTWKAHDMRCAPCTII